MKMFALVWEFSLLLLLFSFSTDQVSVDVKNFHKVSNDLYRSAQPDRKEMVQLEEIGIKTLINLRLRRDDKQEIKGTGLTQIRIPIKTQKLTYNDMLESMRSFKNAEKPVLVHCRRGSDRTGCFIACYRLVFQNWSKEKAIEELLNEDLGYYKKMFPNILKFIEELDVNQFKADIDQSQ